MRPKHSRSMISALAPRDELDGLLAGAAPGFVPLAAPARASCGARRAVMSSGDMPRVIAASFLARPPLAIAWP